MYSEITNHWKASHASDTVLLLEVLSNGDLPGTVVWIREGGLRSIHVDEFIDSPLCGFLGVGSGHSDLLELAKVLLENGAPPVTESILVHGRELGWVTVEGLTDGAGELLSTPKGTIGDVDVDGQGLVELIVQDGAKGREDTLESLNTTAKVVANFSALKEGLLDLGVLLRRPLAHDVV
jgi:hypothetical protein